MENRCGMLHPLTNFFLLDVVCFRPKLRSPFSQISPISFNECHDGVLSVLR